MVASVVDLSQTGTNQPLSGCRLLPGTSLLPTQETDLAILGKEAASYPWELLLKIPNTVFQPNYFRRLSC